MPPPSKLAIATSSVNRLVKEELSYHKELEQQESSIKKLEDANALEETKVMIPTVRNSIASAVAKLEQEMETAQEQDNSSATEEVTKAKEAVENAKASLLKTS
ncbi:putative tubulin-specific chaperone Rbl2 [Pseudovirgaria hyperparasitica]|uniref:Tubulin-specific chaperone A n=1 Tax=Pseudovirgaria hyperparasitica TaxID=470096 RepID=A0A6A6VSU7_9PEZI|nr:putative tubulin-specific chaperone Rbl2 [Pseudovirgaria hyperparasitica]KAF2753748.1 putative tubulin-specific chaperone Rbl2 [Pseudovirgaria hyperparasitica]